MRVLLYIVQGPQVFMYVVKFAHIIIQRDASAERDDATVSRPSVCLSVTFRHHDHIGSNSSRIISRPNRLRPMRSVTPNMGDLMQPNGHTDVDSCRFHVAP